LDIPTEEKLINTIKSMTDKTCIIISHRSEVLAACDRTYILQNGSLKELNNIPPRTIIDQIRLKEENNGKDI
jgi:ABC-type bacteriocin/lantibiotic exporter with double-glycine peptidase domain